MKSDVGNVFTFLKKIIFLHLKLRYSEKSLLLWQGQQPGSVLTTHSDGIPTGFISVYINELGKLLS